METFEDFQNFINEHPEITSMKALSKLYNGVYKKFYKHKFNKKIKFPGKKHLQSWKEYNDLESIQKFINENNIHTRGEIDTKYRGLGVIIEKLKLYPFIKFVPKISLEDAQKYIDDNGVRNMHDFEDNHKDVYLKTFPFRAELKFPHSANNWSNYNTLEDFQKFIDESGINSRKQLSNMYKGLICRFYSIGLNISDLRFPNDPPRIKYKFNLRFKSQEDVQKYINDNNILSSEELKSTEEGNGLFYWCNSRNWKIEFKIKKNNWTEYNTADSFQKFIDSNNIKSPTDFSNNFPGLYSRLVVLRLTDKVTYINKRKSSLEIKIEKILKDLEISFELQKTFEDLKDNYKLRFDIYIPEFNLVIEPGGRQHLMPVDKFNGEEGFKLLTRHDQMKREYCISNNINIIYYFEDTSTRWKYTPNWMMKLIKNYPGECYYLETIDKLIEKLTKLKLERSKSNP